MNKKRNGIMKKKNFLYLKVSMNILHPSSWRLVIELLFKLNFACDEITSKLLYSFVHLVNELIHDCI